MLFVKKFHTYWVHLGIHRHSHSSLNLDGTDHIIHKADQYSLFSSLLQPSLDILVIFNLKNLDQAMNLI